MKNLPAGHEDFYAWHLFFNLFHHHSAAYSANDFQQQTYCSILPFVEIYHSNTTCPTFMFTL